MLCHHLTTITLLNVKHWAELSLPSRSRILSFGGEGRREEKKTQIADAEEHLTIT